MQIPSLPTSYSYSSDRRYIRKRRAARSETFHQVQSIDQLPSSSTTGSAPSDTYGEGGGGCCGGSRDLRQGIYFLEKVSASENSLELNGISNFLVNCSSKKPLFFMGNWTFRERNKTSRPSISDAMREERPQSMNLSDIRGSISTSSRSKSGESPRGITVAGASEFPRNVETRVPVKIERSSMVRRKPSNMTGGSTGNTSASSPSPSFSASSGEFKSEILRLYTEITVFVFAATITVDDDQIAVMRTKKESSTDTTNNNNRYSFQSW